MTKFSVIGILSWVAGGVLLGFQALSALMGTEGGWKSLALVDLLDENKISWIDQISISGLQRLFEAIVNAPLFALFFGVGFLFFVLEYFFGKK